MDVVPSATRRAPRIFMHAYRRRGRGRGRCEDAWVAGGVAEAGPVVEPGRPGPAPVAREVTPDGSVVAVIDGMGGHGGGDEAAAWVAGRLVAARWTSKRAAVDGLKALHLDLLRHAMVDSAAPDMGAAAAGLAILPDGAWAWNVGDVGLWAATTPWRRLSVSDRTANGRLEQCLGGGMVDYGIAIAIRPHACWWGWEVGTRLVLASDGLWSSWTAEEQAAAMEPGLTTAEMAARLWVAAGRADDDATLVVVEARWPDDGEAAGGGG